MSLHSSLFYDSHRLVTSIEHAYLPPVKRRVERTRGAANGRRYNQEQRISETLTIDVKPGWKKGTKITFPEKGDEVGVRLVAFFLSFFPLRAAAPRAVASLLFFAHHSVPHARVMHTRARARFLFALVLFCFFHLMRELSEGGLISPH